MGLKGTIRAAVGDGPEVGSGTNTRRSTTGLKGEKNGEEREGLAFFSLFDVLLALQRVTGWPRAHPSRNTRLTGIAIGT